MSNPVPNLPPTSGVQDLAVRSFLDALAQAWTVRNGQTRVTDERFLTVKDLTDGINLFKNGGNALAGNAAPSASANAIAIAISDLSADIMQSRLYRWLGERIDRIKYLNRPDWLPPGNSAMVKEEITELVDDYHALAKKVTTAAAEFNGNLSIARQELSALSTAQEATAKQVTTLQTNVNDNFALVDATLKSHTTSISSQASAITTLQTDVGSSKLTAQQAFDLAQDIDGNLKGTWGVKFDAGGYVAGFGMALDGTTTSPTSMFGVRADKFFIGPPAINGVNGQAGSISVNQLDSDSADRYALPFIVTTSNWTSPSDGKTYSPGVWINTARIADLTVGRLKIMAFNQLSHGTVAMTNGKSTEVTVNHMLGRPVIPVLAWNTPQGEYHSMVLTYLDNLSFRFVMYAVQGGVGYSGTVTYGYGFI